jgi:acetyl-CoA synthetase
VASTGRFSVSEAYRILSTHKVTCPFLAATVLRLMRVEPPPAELPINLRGIVTGGEMVAPELIKWARKTFGAAVNEIFGTTESVHISVACEALFETPYGAMGLPLPGREVSIIDPLGNPLPQGESGEIVIDANDPVVMLEFWNNPEKTAEKLAGGWAHTFDAGYIDDEGYLHFQGRQDDLIMSAGHRVGPDEVECYLLTHDSVVEACVVGLPDERIGELVAAFVRLRDGVGPSPELAEELKQHVKIKLAAHAYPRVVEFVDTFPVTTTGKILRGQVRQKYLGDKR